MADRNFFDRVSEAVSAFRGSSPANIGGTLAPVVGSSAQNLPTAPPDNAYSDPVGIGRLGLESYRGYWGMYPGDVRIQLEQMFGWASICEGILADDCASPDRVAMEESVVGGQLKRDPCKYDHWFSMLLKNPMPGQLGPHDFMKMISLWYDMTPGGVFLAAECYDDKEASLFPTSNGNLIGKPATFNILEPSRMVIVLDPDVLVRQYIYQSNSGIRYFQPWEICHIRNPYPSDDPIKHRIWGTCTREQAMQTIRAASSIRDYITDFYQKFRMPPVMITKSKGAWTQDERNDYTAAYIKRMSTFGPGFIFGDEKVTPSVIDVGKTGADNIHLQNGSLAEEICAFYRVQYVRVLGKEQGKNTAKADTSSYYQGPIKSRLQTFYEQITIWAKRYQMNVSVEAVPPADDNSEFEDKVRLQMISVGGLSPKEYANANGVECTNPLGDQFLIAGTYKGFEAGLNPTTPTPDNGGNKDSASASVATEAMRRMALRSRKTLREEDAEEDDGEGFNKKDAAYNCFRSLTDIQKKHRTQIERKVSAAFGQVEKEVKKNIDRSMRALRTGDAQTDIESPFDKDEFKRKLSEECGESVAELIAETIAEQCKDAGFNPAETDWAKVIERAVEKSLDQIESCADTASDELRELLKSMKDSPADEIAKAITDKFDFYQDARAHNIAQTTSTSAQGFTSTQVHKELDLQTKWLDLRLSASPRAGHIAMHNKLADADGYFHVPDEKGKVSRMKYPGDPSAPANQVCECKCQTQGVRKK